ncbi:MAG: hypothetical protein ABFS18_03290 [Thermodesulfobacteriota bacterium]
MAKLRVLFWVFLLCTIPNTALCKDYTAEDIKNMGGKLIECTVETVKAYNFFVSFEKGKELNILTNKETKFIPSNERLYKGDLVKVLLFEPLDGSNSIAKSIAYSVEIVKRAKREFVKSPKIGVYSLYKDRSGGAVYFPDVDKLIKFENFENSAEADLWLEAGKKYEISFKVVPARIGNGYVYVTKSIKQAPGEKYPSTGEVVNAFGF